MKRKTTFSVILSFLLASSIPGELSAREMTDTTSPQLLHTPAEISFVRSKISSSQQPWQNAYTNLISLANNYATRTHEVVDTFRVPRFYNDAAGHTAAKIKLLYDAHAAYTNALAYQLSDDSVYAQKAIYFINAWATGNRVISTREDAPLVTAYCGWGFLQAADLLIGSPYWPQANIDTFKTWLSNVYLPIVENIRARKNNWGDWATFASASSYVLLEDTAKFSAAIDSMRLRINRSIAADGHMPEEVAREGNGLWYTYFSLTPMTLSAKLALNVRGVDLFNWVSDSSRSLKSALDYYFYYNRNKAQWPWYTMSAGGPQDKDDPVSLYEAMNNFYLGKYDAFAAGFRPVLGGYKGSNLSHLPWAFPTLMNTWEPDTFQPDRIAVSRAGSGNEALGTSTVSMFIDEYTGTGERTKILAVPAQTVSGNYRLTTIGNTGFEGLLTRSANGAYLTLAGYDAAPGTTPSSTVKRVLALVSADGSINSSTAFTTGSANPRSVVTNDGTGFWMASGGAGVRYAAIGATAATTISTFPSSSRSVEIFNGQLYGITNSSGMRIATVGSGLPTTTGQTLTGLPGIPADGITANQVVFFDTDANGDPDLLYFVNDGGTSPGPGSAALHKYILNAAGTTWISKGSFSSAGFTEGLKGITGKMTGDTAILYTVSMGNAPTSTSSSLMRIVDVSKTNDIGIVTPSLSVIAYADFKTAFKGVAFTPGVASAYRTANTSRKKSVVAFISADSFANTSLTVTGTGNEREAIIYARTGSSAILQITGMEGRVLTRLNIKLTKGNNRVNLPVANLSAGIYIVTLTDANGQKSTRFYK